MANDGQVVIDLSQQHWWGEPGPSYELAASAVGARINVSPTHVNFSADPYDDIDAILAATVPQDYSGLAEFGQAFELANTAELIRQEQDAAPLPVRTEDRIAAALARWADGTYTPEGQYAREFASPAQGGVTGMATCRDGSADEFGYCRNMHHEAGCGSAATPDIVEQLKPQLERFAHRPYLGEDGQVWYDRQFGSPMSLVDHVEALTGIRQGDVGLFETGKARRWPRCSAP